MTIGVRFFLGIIIVWTFLRVQVFSQSDSSIQARGHGTPYQNDCQYDPRPLHILWPPHLYSVETRNSLASPRGISVLATRVKFPAIDLPTSSPPRTINLARASTVMMSTVLSHCTPILIPRFAPTLHPNQTVATEFEPCSAGPPVVTPMAWFARCTHDVKSSR